MNKEQTKKTDLLIMLLRPVVRFALRHGVKFQETSQLLKLCFVEEAKRELVSANLKINMSRLSVATGLQRKDLEKIQNSKSEISKSGLISKVIGHWSLAKNYCEKNGKPKKLTAEGADSEFVKLVKAVSKDLHPGTLMFELERMGLVSRENDLVQLETKVLDLGHQPIETFKLLSENCNDLITAVEQNIFDENIQTKKILPNLHATTQFSNIDQAKIGRVREWLLLEGSAFNAKVRKFLAEYDLDINPSKEGKSGVRVSLGTFSIIDKEVI